LECFRVEDIQVCTVSYGEVIEPDDLNVSVTQCLRVILSKAKELIGKLPR